MRNALVWNNLITYQTTAAAVIKILPYMYLLKKKVLHTNYSN